ncbi:MAG: TraU family protein [Gammaproteobacteria bacterium]|nr:TraU family protein [Gammaproteobacteria bacterium]
MKSSIISVLLASMFLLAGTTYADHHDGDALPGGLGISRNASDSFTSVDMLATSIQGMLDPSCGGYCIIGVCSHLRVRFTWKGIRIYTVISPKLRHPYPELLVSSYNHVGDEPFLEWRNSFGSIMGGVAASLGVAGGRPEPIMLDQHQAASFKEVDIIGHPLTIMPSLVDRNGSTNPFARDPVSSLREPSSFNSPDLSGPDTGDAEEDGLGSIDIKEMIRNTLSGVASTAMRTIMENYRLAMLALRAVNIVNDIVEMAEYFRSLAALMDNIVMIAEISARSTIWVNAIDPRFQSPRLFCPVNTKALQPYYLSFADFFWWRSGFPITDGPIGGDNHLLDILNPISADTLPVDATPVNPLSEVWGRLYPRDGMLNQTHDAKTASVIAWRGMDVLHNSLPGSRIGIPLPAPPREWQFVVDQPKWQMIYPEVKSCEDTPYYPSSSLFTDFMAPNEFGGYAWNYYRTYTCCSNTRGRRLISIDFPIPLCITLGQINDDASARAEEEWCPGC